MSQIVDLNGRYTETGSLLQLEYAKKAADAGSTVIGIKFSDGVLLAAELPHTSSLALRVCNRAIATVAANVAVAHTGLPHDSNVIEELLRYNSNNILRDYERPVSCGELSEMLGNYLRYFGSSPYTRPVGCSFLVSSCSGGKFTLTHFDPSGHAMPCRAYAVGKGAQASKTELEKLEFGSMALDDAIRNAVRILYIAYDPVRDKDFDIEMVYISRDSGGRHQRVLQDVVRGYANEFSDLAMDTA